MWKIEHCVRVDAGQQKLKVHNVICNQSLKKAFNENWLGLMKIKHMGHIQAQRTLSLCTAIDFFIALSLKWYPVSWAETFLKVEQRSFQRGTVSLCRSKDCKITVLWGWSNHSGWATRHPSFFISKKVELEWTRPNSSWLL